MNLRLNLSAVIGSLLAAYAMCASCSNDDKSDKKPAGAFGGTWTLGENAYCTPSASKSTGTKTSLSIYNGFIYKEEVFAYADSGCTDKAITVNQYGRLAILGNVEGIDNAYKVVRSVEKFDVIWHTDAGVDGANAGEGYCGLKNWKKDTAQTVTNKSCKNEDGKDISFAYKARIVSKQNRDRLIIKFGDGNKTMLFGSDKSRKNADDDSDKCELLDDAKTATSCFPTELEENKNLIYYKVGK